MASIEYIKKRVEGKEKEIVKMEKKLERIKKAQATDWEVNPYYYDEGDLKSTERDLAEAREKLENLKNELKKAEEKAASRDVKAIIDFLEVWKQNTRQFYSDSIPRFLKARAEYWEKEKKLDWTVLKERQRILKERKQLREAFIERWGYMLEYIPHGDNFDWERFERDIKNEADKKYDDIIKRTNKIVGKITDASNLEVGYKGDLDGYVIGEKGIAHVHTVGAGGYNVQCFHFRVLVHEVK